MNDSNDPRLDPNFRYETCRPGEKQLAFIEVANREALEWVRDHPGVGSDFVHIVGGYCSASVEGACVKQLRQHAGVLEIEANRLLKPQLVHSVPAIGVDQTRGGLGQSGAGVVIGIVDYGIDFTLDDFKQRGEMDKTRIAFLWDQQLNSELPGEKPPAKYRYGVEYSAADINRGLRAPGDPFTLVRHSPTDSRSDVSGHGTHVTGIAAGNGSSGYRGAPAGNYSGVAPDATIVFVHLNRKEILSGIEAEGTLANSVQLAHAIAYCFEKADELGMPCVVNLSMGFNGGGHDGNTAVEWIIDTLLERPGRAVVVAAGNEDASGLSYAGYLQNSPTALAWEHGILLPDGPTFINDPSTNEMEIWYSSKSRVKVRVIDPDGQASDSVAPGRSRKPFTFDGGEKVEIVSDRYTPWHGDARIRIRLNGDESAGIRFGTWQVELTATSAAPEEAETGVRFNAWIERTTPIDAPPEWRSRFADAPAAESITITTPATSRRVIAVANYAIGTSAEWPVDESGRGPTRDGRRKPELAAPGRGIFSSRARPGDDAPVRQQMTGTSMSAPHVAGVVALLLSRQNYLTCDEIRDLLIRSANPVFKGLDTDSFGRDAPRALQVHTSDAAYKDLTWHPKLGYGKVDAARAMELLEELLEHKGK